MSTKNYLLVTGVINLLFGISLVFLPAMMTDQYITSPGMRSDVTDFLCKLLGVLLFSVAVGNFVSCSSEPSPARKAFVITGIIGDWGTVFVHIMAISHGIEKSFAWGTVGLLAIMGLWGLVVLKSNK